jgi:type I restriction enzyme S subunit
MSGRYKAYQEYKDSGSEWLGSLPEHWKSCRLKQLVDDSRRIAMCRRPWVRIDSVHAFFKNRRLLVFHAQKLILKSAKITRQKPSIDGF